MVIRRSGEEVVHRHESTHVEDELTCQVHSRYDLPVFNQLEVFTLLRRVEVNYNVEEEQKFCNDVDSIPEWSVYYARRKRDLIRPENTCEQQDHSHEHVPEGNESAVRVQQVLRFDFQTLLQGGCCFPHNLHARSVFMFHLAFFGAVNLGVGAFFIRRVRRRAKLAILRVVRQQQVMELDLWLEL